jgi:CRP-like cAMP-binding protein
MPRDAIRSLPLFRGLAPRDVDLLAARFHRGSFAALETVFAQGDRAERLFILISGKVAIRFKPHDGEILTVSTITPGGVFGWSAALDRAAYSSCAVALEPSEAISISGVDLRHLCSTHPRTGVMILERLAGVIADRLSNTHAKVVDVLQQGMGKDKLD